MVGQGDVIVQVQFMFQTLRPHRLTSFSDLGFHRSRLFFMCPVCPHVGSMFARELGPGRGGLVQSGRIRAAAGPAAPELARPMVYTFAGVLSFGFLIQLRSVKPTGSVRSHERRTGRAGRGQPEVSRKRG